MFIYKSAVCGLVIILFLMAIWNYTLRVQLPGLGPTVLRGFRTTEAMKALDNFCQSELDPFNMHYCVVISGLREYNSMCEATHDMNVEQVESAVAKWKNFSYDPRRPRVIVGCVKKKTSYTVDNLEPGKKYYFNVFVTNKKTNLSLPYGNTSILFDNRTRALGLKDNKPVSVSLRRLDGKAVFRYKVTSKVKLGAPLEWHILPCGGVVEAEIKLKRKVIIPRQNISSYQRLVIEKPTPGQRYALHIISPNSEELQHTSGVEVIATTQGTGLQLGLFPEEAQVTEYIGLRQCSSVTVGWRPVTEHDSSSYCIRVKELTHHIPFHQLSARLNQCGLDNRLKSSTDYVLTHCIERSPNDYTSLMTQQISNLKPGKHYMIQITVKRTKGRILSYDSLHVQTKSKCS